MTKRELFERGDWLGEYEILGRLRAGGMATLFLGRRHNTAGVSRPVVIKVIHPHLAEDDLIVRMFIDEARISSHISHPNVVYIEKFGEHDGIYYMAMEYVDGCSLDQLLRTLQRRDEMLPPAIAAHLVIEAAAGAHAAHETADEDGTNLGIVHRDVSPSNVLLTRNGRVKLIDFGIAKARNRLGATQSGASLKGKLRYMSPEQAWGRDIDRRTDVYALGIVLWELLCRRPLYKAADDMATLELVRDAKVPPPRSINPEVSIALEAVVLRATAKDPAVRIATADELRSELIRAQPDAVSVPAEELGKLVENVRATLGVSEAEDRRATTPAQPRTESLSFAELIFEEPPTVPSQTSPASSIRGSAGEVVGAAHPRTSPWLLAGAAVALVAATVLVVKLAGGSASDAANTAPRDGSGVESVPQAAAPRVPADAGAVAVVTDAALADAPRSTIASPNTGASKRPAGASKPAAGAVTVDGVILADRPGAAGKKPAGKPKPKPKPKAVHADGTVLSE